MYGNSMRENRETSSTSTDQMIQEKRIGTLNYDVIANRYENDFRAKWVTDEPKNRMSLLGTSDIQSLADLTNSYDVSNKMRITPFGKNSIIILIVLTVIPYDKILAQIFWLIF